MVSTLLKNVSRIGSFIQVEVKPVELEIHHQELSPPQSFFYTSLWAQTIHPNKSNAKIASLDHIKKHRQPQFLKRKHRVHGTGIFACMNWLIFCNVNVGKWGLGLLNQEIVEQKTPKIQS